MILWFYDSLGLAHANLKSIVLQNCLLLNHFLCANAKFNLCFVLMLLSCLAYPNNSLTTNLDSGLCSWIWLSNPRVTFMDFAKEDWNDKVIPS